jgi:hypothetical protein
LKLYKFYSNSAYLLTLIEYSELYFNSFDLFNDPYEKYTICFDSKKQKPYVEKNIKKNIKVCCFTQTYNNYLMWSHYANAHKGFCVEFDFTEILKQTKLKNVFQFNFGNHDILLAPVKYDYYQLPLNIDSKVSVLNTMQSLRICTHKFNCWKYEQEYRAILESERAKSITIPHQCIKGVYYGFNIPENVKTRISNKITSFRKDIFQHEVSLIPNKGSFE